MYAFGASDNGNNITDCLYGWEYDTSIISSSIVIDVIQKALITNWHFKLYYLLFSLNWSVHAVSIRLLACPC